MIVFAGDRAAAVVSGLQANRQRIC